MQQRSQLALPAAVLLPLLVLCAWMLLHVLCTACSCGDDTTRKRSQRGSLPPLLLAACPAAAAAYSVPPAVVSLAAFTA